MTLIEILRKTKNARESGEFGLNACKEAVRRDLEFGYFDRKTGHVKKVESPYELLDHYVDRANNEPMFNDVMVHACWQIINEE